MGNQDSKDLLPKQCVPVKSQTAKKAVEHFSSDEQLLLKSVYDSICLDQNKICSGFDLEDFTKWLRKSFAVSTSLAKAVFEELLRLAENKTNRIDFDTYIVASWRLEKERNFSKSDFLMHLLESSSDTFDGLMHLLSFYIFLEEKVTVFQSWSFSENLNRQLASIVTFLCKGNKQISTETCERLLCGNSFICTACDVVFYCVVTGLFRESLISSLPFQTVPALSKLLPSNFRSLLSISQLLFICHNLPSLKENQFQLLYDSVSHGESFTNFAHQITNHGPLLIVIRDSKGHIFGGYMSQSLTVSPSFQGDDNCFLFQLEPDVYIFQATGYNQNYCYLNQHQETMPNGFGMGGLISMDHQRVHYFALWLDKNNFGQGKSQSNQTTFGNRQLSAEEHFKVDRIEVWGLVTMLEKDGDKSSRVVSSILDTNPEAKALLAMTGRGPVSEGLRESDRTAGNPEMPDDKMRRGSMVD